jgi:hypothetical protein
VVSRGDNRRRELIKRCEALKKQEVRCHDSEHAYRDTEWEERVKEDCGPGVYKTVLTGRGREA